MESQSRDFNQIEFSDDSVLVYQPRYTDATKSRVKAIVRLPNGRFMEIEKACDDRGSKIVRDIFLQYTDAEITEFSRREAAVVDKKQKVETAAAERGAKAQEQALTFQAKVQALAIPEVKDFPDKRLARRIRKAKNPFEVAALVSIVMQKSFESMPEIQE